MANPTLLDMPIARDGNKNAIPTTDNGTTGLLSQQYGWQLINAIPPQQGGKAVKREDFNGALYLLSNLLFYLQKGWQFEWDPNQAYYAGCVVKDPSDGKMYQRLNDGTSTTAPHSDNTNWKLWDLSAYMPLAGGAMSGVISKNTDNSALTLKGGVVGNASAVLDLCGKDHPSAKGYFSLEANDGTNSKTLLGTPDGILDWGDKDLGGSAIVAKSLGKNGYIKYASGQIWQWGTFGNEDSTTADFPIAFATNNVRIVATPQDDTRTGVSVTVHNVSTTSFVCDILNNAGLAKDVDWIAVGY